MKKPRINNRRTNIFNEAPFEQENHSNLQASVNEKALITKRIENLMAATVLLCFSLIGCTDSSKNTNQDNASIDAFSPIVNTQTPPEKPISPPPSNETPEQVIERNIRQKINETIILAGKTFRQESSQATKSTAKLSKVAQIYLKLYPYHVFSEAIKLRSNQSNQEIYPVLDEIIKEFAQRVTEPNKKFEENFPQIKLNIDTLGGNIEIKIPEHQVIELFLHNIVLWKDQPYALEIIQNFAKKYPRTTLKYFPEISSYFDYSTNVKIAAIAAEKCPSAAIEEQSIYRKILKSDIGEEIVNMATKNNLPSQNKQCDNLSFK